MSEQFQKSLTDVKNIGKLIGIAIAVGVPCGLIGSAFHMAVNEANALRASHPWILFLLPVLGLCIAFIYRKSGIVGVGTNDVIDSVSSGKRISIFLLPVMFISTVLTHLGGGSAGREGAALQMGGTIGFITGNILKLSNHERRMATQCGMAAFFSALFGTPLAATFFALTIVQVGVVFYSSYIPCLLSSLIAYGISVGFGIEPTRFSLTASDFNWKTVLSVIILGIICALAVRFFCFVLKKSHTYIHKWFKNIYLSIFTGGILIVVLTLLYGSTRYNGAGMDVIQEAIENGNALPWDWIMKILFTSITLAAGYKGGEVVPCFFIGSTLGCVIGPYIGIPAGFAAGLGLIGVFCGATNCVIASLLLAIELFGSEGMWYFAIICAVTYALSGYAGLYSSQEFLSDKLQPEYHEKDQ